MKKILCVALLFALLAGLAACAKKGEIFKEPPTEIITLENGETVVYEVVTNESGVAVTDEEGETKLIIYDPPVTEKGGYLVTDAQGSTIKQSQTTATAAAVENGAGSLDEPNATAVQGGTANQGSTTAAQTNAAGETVSAAQPTTQAGKPAATVPATGVVDQTYPLTGTLTKKQAEKLLGILGFENKFDADLCNGDFAAAQNSLVTYIADINLAVASIKSDAVLYKFVGAQNLAAWQSNMIEAQKRYGLFMNMFEKEKDSPKKSGLYITAYTDFQEAYRCSLEAYYCMQIAAEKLA